ncbi:MAG: hypothetical protein QG657_4821, partial [Acidobacteriota bacterium]|nr:hypothetical protein [Acidobacteriota bacterium]
AENGATLFMMLYAVVDVFLYYYSGQNDIVMGIAAAGREHPDLEDQIGFFINTLAVRVKFREEAAFLELVGVVKKAILDAYAHQMYPLDRLIDELKIKKNPARQPLFDVMIGITNFQGAKPSTSLPPEPVKTDEDETSLTIYDFLTLYDLSFDFRETARTINVAIEYNTDLFERKTITRMIKRFKKLLERIVKNPAISISSLQIDEEIKIPGFASFGGR